MKIVQKIWAELSAQPKKVELAAMQDADALYNKLVKGAQAGQSCLHNLKRLN